MSHFIFNGFTGHGLVRLSSNSADKSPKLCGDKGSDFVSDEQNCVIDYRLIIIHAMTSHAHIR